MLKLFCILIAVVGSWICVYVGENSELHSIKGQLYCILIQQINFCKPLSLPSGKKNFIFLPAFHSYSRHIWNIFNIIFFISYIVWKEEECVEQLY